MARRVSTKALQAEFNAKARTYESGRLAGWYRAQAELVLGIARPRAGSLVLDVGCGTGYLLRRLVGGHSGVEGLGIDLSPRMVDEAREKARIEAVDGLTFVTGDWARLDPELLLQAHGYRRVGLACCVSTLHYFSQPEAALEKIFRVMEPGGRLLLLDRAREGSLMTLFWDGVHRLVLRDAARFYRTDELVGLLEAAGFEDMRVERRVRKLFWKGKLSTSLVLVSARRGAGS